MTTTQIRNIIRAEANANGIKYRITAAGEVHFYAPMPGGNQIGWYFVGSDAAQVAKAIKAGNR